MKNALPPGNNFDEQLFDRECLRRPRTILLPVKLIYVRLRKMCFWSTNEECMQRDLREATSNIGFRVDKINKVSLLASWWSKLQILEQTVCKTLEIIDVHKISWNSISRSWTIYRYSNMYSKTNNNYMLIYCDWWSNEFSNSIHANAYLVVSNSSLTHFVSFSKVHPISLSCVREKSDLVSEQIQQTKNKV